jgi:hypothetical protein
MFSVLSQPRVGNYPERGARLARREERAYREYVSEEQRSQTGCPARRIVKAWPGQDTKTGRSTRATQETAMKKSNFALRLQPSLMEEARRVATAEGVAVNQLINVAVAEKLSALRTEEYFAERAAKGDVTKALKILKRAGVGNPPVRGDELDIPPPRRRVLGRSRKRRRAGTR